MTLTLEFLQQRLAEEPQGSVALAQREGSSPAREPRLSVGSCQSSRVFPEPQSQGSGPEEPSQVLPPAPPAPQGVTENPACKMSGPPLLDYINAKMY